MKDVSFNVKRGLQIILFTLLCMLCTVPGYADEDLEAAAIIIKENSVLALKLEKEFWGAVVKKENLVPFIKGEFTGFKSGSTQQTFNRDQFISFVKKARIVRFTISKVIGTRVGDFLLTSYKLDTRPLLSSVRGANQSLWKFDATSSTWKKLSQQIKNKS